MCLALLLVQAVCMAQYEQRTLHTVHHARDARLANSTPGGAEDLIGVGTIAGVKFLLDPKVDVYVFGCLIATIYAGIMLRAVGLLLWHGVETLKSVLWRRSPITPEQRLLEASVDVLKQGFSRESKDIDTAHLVVRSNEDCTAREEIETSGGPAHERRESNPLHPTQTQQGTTRPARERRESNPVHPTQTQQGTTRPPF